MLLIFTSILSFFLTWFSIKKLLPYFKKNFISNPNERSAHKIPIPLGGGIIIYIFGTIFLAINKNYLPLFCLPLVFIGILDDKYNIQRKYRFSIQIITSILLLTFSETKIIFNLSDLFLIKFLIIFLVIFLCSGIINFINFMDGIDGLIGSCMSIIFIFAGINYFYNIWPLIAAIAGFIIWNWKPAKIFMGDTGSTFLGAFYVGLILNSQNYYDQIGLILIATPLLADASFCLIYRLIKKQSIFDAHDLHLYQRLTKSGWSHAKVSSLYLSATTFLGIIFLIKNLYYLIISSLIIVLLGFLINKKYTYQEFIN